MVGVEGERWLVLGSGPGAEEGYRRFRREVDVVATCNNGLRWCPGPDVYWLTDSTAVGLYWEAAREAKRRGAVIVTSEAALVYRPRLRLLADVVVRYSLEWGKRWEPGRLCNGRTSGCFLVQMAVNAGARVVVMAGMGGYRSGPEREERDYDDGRRGSAHHEETMRYYGPMLQSVMDQSRGVRFVFASAPNWPWRGENVEVATADARNGAR